MLEKTSNTILIVDENSENLELLSNYLNNEGYKTILASNTSIAIHEAKKVGAALILIDFKLLDKNGYELYIRLNKFNELRNTPIIFIQAATDEELITKGFEIGGNDYITKPFKKLEILTKIKNQLQIVNANKLFEQEKEKWKHIAIEEIPDGFWDWNLKTNEAYFSNYYENMLGYNSGELSGSIESWLRLLHPDDKMSAMETLINYLNKDTSNYEASFRMRNKTGNYRWIYSRGKAEFDEDGKAVRIMGLNTDITDIKTTSLELKKSNVELKNNLDKIKQTNSQLTKAQKKIEENNNLKTTLTRNICEEIKPIMNKVLDYTKSLGGTDLAEEQKKLYIETIQEGSNQALNLIHELVETSKTNTIQISNSLSNKTIQSKEPVEYSKSTVLIAEDDDISYSFIKEILSKYKIKILRANNGKEAIEQVKNNSGIDLILMDIKMPIMDGLEATQAIIKENKKIPIIAQTAYASESDKKKVTEAGCIGYITKPIDKIEVEKVLEKYLKANFVNLH